VQNTAFSTNKTLNINGRIIDLTTPKIMAVLNVTPDSFYDGGRNFTEKDILKLAEKSLADGAAFLDVGGYSSRPGASDIPESEELARVLPAIKSIRKEFPNLIISIDTFRSGVARQAVLEGAQMINDISGGALDKAMFETVATLHVPYVIMHMKGNPQDMAGQASYQNITQELLDYFHPRVHQLQQLGIHDMLIDPGFGFAKTRAHNFELLNQLELLQVLGKPMLAGLSRKSMIWKTLDIKPDDALNGTTVLNTIALIKGVSVLRVHDVKEAVQVVKLVEALRS
jgi:dihydropteroate synthase